MQRQSSIWPRVILVLMLASILSTSTRAHPGAGIAVDRLGQVYFLDTGSGLWRIDTRGGLTHLSNTLFHWLALDENNRFGNTQFPSGALGEILQIGANPSVLLSSDYPIAVSREGNLYYPSGQPGNLRMMRMTPDGTTSGIATLPPTVNGTSLGYLGGVFAGPDGSLYYTEDSAIKRITPRGIIGTAVTVRAPAQAPSVPATNTHPYLRGLAVDARGVMYVADSADARVLKITTGGEITTLLETQTPWSPTAVAVFGSDVYVLEFLHTTRDVRRDWLPRVRKIAANGKSTIIATVDQMPGAR